ncbi:MAG: UvrD-helicase domain-containing protein [Bacteroidales bacterium]
MGIFNSVMTSGILTKYNASAGSGKTFRLTGAYLDHLFRVPNNHRNILAVTFTNKAAAEMKERILGSLFLLGSGKGRDYIDQIHEKTGLPEDIIREKPVRTLKRFRTTTQGFQSEQ